jgi:transcriptional regulator of heat shock response
MLTDLGRREAEILAIIIRHYVDTAEPVSSRFVSKRLNLSSATIRNVMADLEELGYITHPYTSAGRIPTDKGYRVYIDSLMHIRKLNDHTARAIEEEYTEAIRSLEDVLERTSHLISSLTNYVGISLFPQRDKVYLDGASHIIEQPEFKDFKRLHSFLQYLEKKTEIINLLKSDIEDCRLTVRIGKENKASDLNECSVVSRGYRVKGKKSGGVCVIGPKRMVYEKVIPTVEFLADTVTNLLDRMED